MSYKECEQSLKQLEQVVSISNPGINGIFKRSWFCWVLESLLITKISLQELQENRGLNASRTHTPLLQRRAARRRHAEFSALPR